MTVELLQYTHSWHAMNGSVVRRLVCASPLAPFIDCFWIHCGYRQPHTRERVLPTATADVIFAVDFVGRARSSIAGPRTTFVDLETSQPFSAIGIHFKPGGASPFFDPPSSELRDRHVTLDLLWGTFAATVSDRLWSASAPDDQFDILEDALRQKMRQPLVRHPAVQYALDALERSSGARSVDAMARELGMSSRRLLDVFQLEVGLSPTAFRRIRRFAAVLPRLEGAAVVDWSDLALSCGYFDQAHFNHDFRAFAGVNPSAYLRHQTSRTHVAIR